MHRHIKIILASSLIVVCSFVNAHAAEKMKPGLWEMRMKSDQMKDAPKMPKMTPEQIEQMKKMGIKMPTMENDEMINKVCITKEMAEKDFSEMAKKEHSKCQTKNINNSGNNYSVELICDSPDLKGTGKIKGTYNSNNTIQSTYDFEGTSRGKPVKHHVETTGKWLTSDCGDVKPMSDFSKKK